MVAVTISTAGGSLKYLTIGLLAASLLAGCRSPAPPDLPGTPIVPPSSSSAPDPATLRAQLAEVPKIADELLAARAIKYLGQLPYDPGRAINLTTIQASKLALTSPETAALQARGFAISDRLSFLTFIHGYRDIYSQHLPVYVSADSVLYALHRSYDAIFRTLELTELIPRLQQTLDGARAHLAATTAGSPESRADADLFLSVAASLLGGKTATPVAGADGDAVGKLVTKANDAEGAEEVTLFGVTRTLDFSQFTPRGHYLLTPELTQYFRAMIWLGRTELRLIETLQDGSQVFRRRQFDAAVTLRSLLGEAELAQWKSVDQVVRAFVGEPDDLSVPDLDRLMADLGANTPADLAGKTDQEIAAKILEKGYGTQRIAAQIMVNGLEKDTLPLGRSFLFFGQRYVLDSHVFSNVVYDRVKKAAVKRLMPDPLDVAFAALGNDTAVALLGPELRKYDYASELGSMRVLADGHGSDFWQANLYNRWLGSLRDLSPVHDLAAQAALPSVARTEAWSRRMLNTQLASWAELRHDTILYAKQSYGASVACQYPDAYVDPYPAFWRALAALGSDGSALVTALGLDSRKSPGDRIKTFFAELTSTASILAEMAERQRTGMPLSPDHLMFINQSVSLKPFGCGGAIAEGWYADLFFDKRESVKFDPTIADVHSQPTDEGGNPVGRVLHVGTGRPRLIVVTVDTCTGPRAYAGVVSSYFERVTDDWKRLSDQEWAADLRTNRPAEVRWMRDLVVH